MIKLNLAKKTLLISLLMSVSAHTFAFDFQGALKDAAKEAVKKQIDPSGNNTNNTSDTEKPASDAKITDLSKAEPPIFNWQNPSIDEEILLGREITGNLLGAAPLVKDAALQNYVNSVGRWVASQSDRADLPWHFGVIESDDLNAFAAPGGFVLITKGLYKKMTNEAQLAGVLGHEIGHIVKKHQLKVLQKQQLLNIGSNFLSDKYAKDNKLVSSAIGSGAEISARSLDKTAEYEADRLGITFATRAGYEPYGLVDVLQTLSQTSVNDGSVALLFKTHPHPDERLARLGDAVGNKLDNVKNGQTLEKRFYKLRN